MTWLGSLAGRFAAWFIRQVDRMPNIATRPALKSYQRLGDALAGFTPDYSALTAARQSGARVSKRKRGGNIVIIIDVPQKGGTSTRLRLKFREKT